MSSSTPTIGRPHAPHRSPAERRPVSLVHAPHARVLSLDLAAPAAAPDAALAHAGGGVPSAAFEEQLAGAASVALRLEALRRRGALDAEAAALAALPGQLRRVRACDGRAVHVAANVAREFAGRTDFTLVAAGGAVGAALHRLRGLCRTPGVRAVLHELDGPTPPPLGAVAIGLLDASPSFDAVAGALAELRGRGHAAIVITDETAVARAALYADWMLVLPATVPALAPALAAAALDVLARRLAGARAVPFHRSHERDV